MATADPNLDKLRSDLALIQSQVKLSRATLGKPNLPKKQRTQVLQKLHNLKTQQSNANVKLARYELESSNTKLKHSRKENNQLKLELKALKQAQPPNKKQKRKHNHNNNNINDSNDDSKSNIGSQDQTQSISSIDDLSEEKMKSMFGTFMSWMQSQKQGESENNGNNSNNQQPTQDITDTMKTKIMTTSKVEELKEVQVYKGIKFSGTGTDRYIKAAEFLTGIRNFEKQGRMIFGFKEDRAIRSIRLNGFTETAALIVAQAVPQAIETFEEFYHWFENTWDMSTARQELYNKFTHFTMPSNITPDELAQHIRHYKQIFESIGSKCSPLVLAQTTLKEIEIINVIYNTMCKEWQLAYDKICELYFRPLDLDIFLSKLAKLTTYIIEYNATHTKQPIPLRSPTKANINKIYQQPMFTPKYNTPYKTGYTGQGRPNYQRTFNNTQNQNKPPKTTPNIPKPTKVYKEPYYIDAWCTICSMGGHTKRFHWIISKKYPKKQMEFATQYQQKRHKQQINKIQQGETNIDPKCVLNKESLFNVKTPIVGTESNDPLQNINGMNE